MCGMTKTMTWFDASKAEEFIGEAIKNSYLGPYLMQKWSDNEYSPKPIEIVVDEFTCRPCLAVNIRLLFACSLNPKSNPEDFTLGKKPMYSYLYDEGCTKEIKDE